MEKPIADQASEHARKFSKELNSGLVSLLVLALHATAETTLYGYQIAQRLEALSEETLPMQAGAIYPVLRSLEAKGLLQSRIEASTSGPSRRCYQITDRGREALAEWQVIWQSTRALVDVVLEHTRHQ